MNSKNFIAHILILSLGSALAHIHQAVTYEQSPGRFGDNLLSYIHAKWISYKYNLPLLYKPFVYSDELILHDKEIKYSTEHHFDKTITLGKNQSVNLSDNSSILYIVPYFPESKWELQAGISFSGKEWDCFEIDWDDQEFLAILHQLIAPKIAIEKLHFPQDTISVALHIRRGGNHDTPETLLAFPLKFLSDEFYINQLRELYSFLHQPCLYVYIFTDDNNPLIITEKMREHFSGYNIIFECRNQNNSDTTHVIEDFFLMQQFDCLIHSESNYSYIPSRLTNYLFSAYPISFHWENNKIIYDGISKKIKLINENHLIHKK